MHSFMVNVIDLGVIKHCYTKIIGLFLILELNILNLGIFTAGDQGSLHFQGPLSFTPGSFHLDVISVATIKCINADSGNHITRFEIVFEGNP